jgi:uncharacterized protein DUF6328
MSDDGHAVQEPGEPGESKKERVDRELIELLNEMRIAIPGVQVLFAFLLTLPFTQKFGELSDRQTAVYFAAFGLAMVASVLLIAPAAHHRITWRLPDKERLLVRAGRLTIAGTVSMAVAMALSVYLIADVLFRAGVAALLAAATIGFVTWMWFGWPIVIRRRYTG